MVEKEPDFVDQRGGRPGGLTGRVDVSQVLATAGILTAAVLMGAAPAGPAAPATAAPQTYCNPISIPDYPLGRRARDVTIGAPVPTDDSLWLMDKQQQYRELLARRGALV